MLAEHARAFQRDGGAAAVIIGAGGVNLVIEHLARSERIVVAGDEVNAARVLRIVATHYRVHIGQLSRLLDSLAGRRSKRIQLDLKAAATRGRVTFELAANPFARCDHAFAGCGEFLVVAADRVAVPEADQLLNGLPNLLR